MTEVFVSSSVKDGEPGELESSENVDDADDYDRIILKDLDDQLLRRIFRGLSGEQ